MMLTKAELAGLRLERVGLNKRDAKNTAKAFFDEVRGMLEVVLVVKHSGFGISGCVTSFTVLDATQRQGRKDPLRRVAWSLFMPAKNSSLMSS